MAPTTRSQASSPTSSKSTTRSSSSSSSSALTNTKTNTSPSQFSNNKPTVAILGTGWAGWTLAQELGHSTSFLSTHNLLILSPTRTMALTPLLASAACSIFDFRIAEEPVRRLSLGKDVVKYQVWCTDVDLEKKRISCRAAVGSNGAEKNPGRIDDKEEEGKNDGEGEGGGEGGGEFQVQYDKLILAPGSEVNTFSTPGVHENCLFMKSVADASTLRERVLDCFELASLPTSSTSQKRSLLHFVIIGGGPTGVELAAELDELVSEHLIGVYKELEGLVKISIYDVADKMLGSFGENLSQYAMQRFKRRDTVNICMGRHIEGFERGVMNVKEDGKVEFGVAVWCTGNKPGALIQNLGIRKDDKGARVLTDRYLRVLNLQQEEESEQTENEKDHSSEKSVRPELFALGDCADILGAELPTTAEVAVQKAKWLAKYLIAGEKGEKFVYKQKATVAYIGRGDGVVEGKTDWTGTSAWLAWRSGTLEWTRSWRRRAMIVLYWLLNKLDGREVARR